MKKLYILSVLALVAGSTAIPTASAYTASNPMMKDVYHARTGGTTSFEREGISAPSDHQEYYGTPEVGVRLLRREKRAALLQQLQQRSINLQKIRNRKVLSLSVSEGGNIYEDLLRRIDPTTIEHYRTPAKLDYRYVWKNGELVKEPLLSPEEIRLAVLKRDQSR